MRIYRYDLACEPEQTIQVPQDCEILSVDSRDGGITMWMAVDPEAPLVEQTFRVVATGEDMPDYFECMFIGTVVLRYSMAEIVYHIFVKAEEVEC